MSEENFWNDENVKEFSEYVGLRIGKNKDIRTQINYLLNDFKSTKQSSIDYEIISFKRVSTNEVEWVLDENSVGTYKNILSNCYGWSADELLGVNRPEDADTVKTGKIKIISVRRKSDNEVFTVGDKIEGFSSTPIITIDKFDISYFTPNTISAYHINGFGRNISAWTKVKEPIPFIWEVNTNNWTIEKVHPSRHCEAYCIKGFDSEDAAKEYILRNAPKLSVA